MPAMFQKKQGGLQPISLNQASPNAQTRKSTMMEANPSTSTLPPSTLDNIDSMNLLFGKEEQSE